MRTRLHTLLTFCVIAMASSLACGQQQEIAVVVNESNHVSAVTTAELKKIFRGERRSWAVGLPIKIIVLPPTTPEHEAMLKLLGMSEHDYKQYWLSLVFRGEVEAEPTNVPSLGMQLEALTVFPGAITLVKAQDMKPGMKALKVDGHLPGEDGYPIRTGR